MGHGLPTAEWEKLVDDSWSAAIAQWKEDNWRGKRVEVPARGLESGGSLPAFTGKVVGWNEKQKGKILVEDPGGETHLVTLKMPAVPKETQTESRDARCAILTKKLRELQALPAGSHVTRTRVVEKTGKKKKAKFVGYEFHLAQTLPKKIAFQVLIFSDDQEAQEKGAALAKAILDAFRRRNPKFGLFSSSAVAVHADVWLQEMEQYWSA